MENDNLANAQRAADHSDSRPFPERGFHSNRRNDVALQLR
jgi:hypothetical protein